MTLASRLVTAYAAALLLAGGALLFAPEVLFPDPGAAGAVPLVVAQLLGASLLGSAAANWAGRGVLLGGIYGRALVVGNQTSAFVGALVLLKALPDRWGPGFWALLLLYACGAVLYTVLLYRSPRAGASPR
jgi:hypothetical protein